MCFVYLFYVRCVHVNPAMWLPCTNKWLIDIAVSLMKFHRFILTGAPGMHVVSKRNLQCSLTDSYSVVLMCALSNGDLSLTLSTIWRSFPLLETIPEPVSTSGLVVCCHDHVYASVYVTWLYCLLIVVVWYRLTGRWCYHGVGQGWLCTI